MDSGFGCLKYKLLFIHGEFKTIQHPFSCFSESDDPRGNYKTVISWVCTKLVELKMERGLVRGSRKNRADSQGREIGYKWRGNQSRLETLVFHGMVQTRARFQKAEDLDSGSDWTKCSLDLPKSFKLFGYHFPPLTRGIMTSSQLPHKVVVTIKMRRCM